MNTSVLLPRRLHRLSRGHIELLVMSLRSSPRLRAQILSISITSLYRTGPWLLPRPSRWRWDLTVFPSICPVQTEPCAKQWVPIPRAATVIGDSIPERKAGCHVSRPAKRRFSTANGKGGGRDDPQPGYLEAGRSLSIRRGHAEKEACVIPPSVFGQVFCLSARLAPLELYAGGRSGRIAMASSAPCPARG